MSHPWASPDAYPALRITLDQPQRWPSAGAAPGPAARAVVAYWRQMTAALARVGGPPPRLQRAHVVLTLHWPDTRHRDVTDWHPLARACVDGLVDAGVVPDGDYRHVVGPDLRHGCVKRRAVAVLDVFDLDDRRVVARG